MDYHEELPLEGIRGFNECLLEYLEGYDGERPHAGTGYQMPCERIAELSSHLSNRWPVQVGLHSQARCILPVSVDSTVLINQLF